MEGPFPALGSVRLDHALPGQLSQVDATRNRRLGVVQLTRHLERDGVILADGPLDAAFAPSGLGGTTRYALALADQPDGKLFVGGGFTTINGTFRRHLARLNPDGSLDTGFDPNAALDAASFIGDIAVLPDGPEALILPLGQL